MSNNLFLDRYCSAASKHLEAILGRAMNDVERGAVREFAEARFRDREASLVNTYTNVHVATTLGKLVTWIDDRNPAPAIITCHGTLFRPHSEFRSISCEMIDFLLKTRKVDKNAMFDLMRAGRPPEDPEVKMLDQRQKIWKLLANSWYGASGERGFMFFDEIIGPAITYNGQCEITTTMFGFESFLGNNLWIRNPNELARHIATCIAQCDALDLFAEWGEPDDYARYSRERVAQQLANACAPGWDCAKAIEHFLGMLPDSALPAVALRGDPYAFLELPRASDLLGVALDGEIREADPGKIEKHHPAGKQALDELWTGLRDWVSVTWVHGDMTKVAEAMTRRVVLTVDTDSNFLNLHPWMQFLGGQYDLSEATENDRLTALNVIIYLLRLLSDDQMARLTESLNVPKEHRGRINFKSEFIIDRILLTEGKKNYTCLLSFQEGAKIEGGMMEMKGLALKKTTTARSTSEFFETTIEDHILRSPKIDRRKVLADIVTHEKNVARVVSDGGTIYAVPGTLNRISEYANAYSMAVVRGMLAWNAAYPNNPIREGDRVNMLRVRVGADVDLLNGEREKWPEGSEERHILGQLLTTFFGPDAGEELSTNGFNWFAFPKDLKELPAWVRPLVDVVSLQLANTAPMLPIIEAVGIRQLRQKPESYSNCVRF